jgi:nucleoside 2-deoxyribosyltransferase
MAFYDRFSELKKTLEKMGYTVLAPELEFETTGDDTSVGGFLERGGGIDAFPPEHEVWKKKGRAIMAHFKKITESDCVLITNYEKKGIPDYIGGNTFLEIGYAYGNNKKIYLLNNIPQQSSFKEELLGMRPTSLGGDIMKIT